MAPAEATVRSACNLLLAGIDEDVKEYIVEMFINGDDSGESLVEALKEFILSYEFCADAESSEAKARELMAAISPSSNAAGGAGDRKAAVAGGGASSAAPKLLEESVRLAEVGGELFKQPAQYELGGRLVGIEEAMEDRKKRKAAREEERRATRRMYDKVAAQRARDDQLLDAARVAAVRLRRERGAYLGAVEAKPFSMPNPGGGPDLLENASFTLQRGRRCVASDVVRPSCPSPPSTFFTRHACPPPAPPPLWPPQVRAHRPQRHRQVDFAAEPGLAAGRRYPAGAHDPLRVAGGEARRCGHGADAAAGGALAGSRPGLTAHPWRL